MKKKLIAFTKCPDSVQGTLRRALSYFKSDFKQKSSAVSNKEDCFLHKNGFTVQ